jgi:hypothetical protein
MITYREALIKALSRDEQRDEAWFKRMEAAEDFVAAYLAYVEGRETEQDMIRFMAYLYWS